MNPPYLKTLADLTYPEKASDDSIVEEKLEAQILDMGATCAKGTWGA